MIYRAAAPALIESDGVEAFLAGTRGTTPPPATVAAPESVPDIADALLPSILRGAGLSDLPAPDEVARIDVPTKILAWVNDPGHPLSTAERLATLLPHATLSVARTPGDVEAWPEVLRRDVGRREPADCADSL